jgi:hypothetical protein
MALLQARFRQFHFNATNTTIGHVSPTSSQITVIQKIFEDFGSGFDQLCAQFSFSIVGLDQN